MTLPPRSRPAIGIGVLGAALAVGVLAGLLVAALISEGEADAPAVGARDFTEILEGSVAVEVDLSGTEAVLLIDTTIDVACSVAYGPTTAFGSLATDADMAGGAHSDHHPVLTGLEPGTSVYWRVQGAAPDGTIYISDVMEFTTPSGQGAAAPNLALGAAVTAVSSEFDDDFAATNAIDGSIATEWSSRGDGDDAFIEIDLGAARDVTGIGFHTREMSDGSAVTNEFTVTVDGGAAQGPFTAGPGLAVADLPVTGRVFRIDLVATTGGNTGAVEIEIYGA
jgi:hypothetical protein